MTTAFELLADPTRRRVLDELRAGERSVGELVERLPHRITVAMKR